MNKVFLGLATLTMGAAFLSAAPPLVPQSPTAKAWANLQQGVTNKHPGKRTNAIHALRLLREDPRAQEMAESALADPNAKVRAAAARVLGLMAALSAVPRLEAALNDKEPAVVLAAAHSLFLLGQPEKAYQIDYEVLRGDRKGTDGFVASQMDELKDSKAVVMMGSRPVSGSRPSAGPHTRCSRESGRITRAL
jgi:hypothetical protein